MQIRKPTWAGAAIMIALALALAPAALAGKSSGGRGGGGGGCHHCAPSSTGSFVGTNPVMVTDNGTSGLSYGDVITFNVTSSASYYFVELDCYQSTTLVYASTVGFYAGWPWSRNYTLQSAGWTGGAANCSARLYSALSDGSNQQTLATQSFNVGA
jgi:hypothetical protein